MSRSATLRSISTGALRMPCRPRLVRAGLATLAIVSGCFSPEDPDADGTAAGTADSSGTSSSGVTDTQTASDPTTQSASDPTSAEASQTDPTEATATDPSES